MQHYIIFLLALTLTLHTKAAELGHAKKFGSRIVGGTPAYAGQFPFAAAIEVVTSNSKHFCTGSLLTREWVFTAGQCVNDAIVFTINLGSHLLRADDINRVTVASSEYVIHPQFDPLLLQNDVGLTKLRFPVELSSYLVPLEQLPTAPTEDYSVVYAIGWGQVSDKNPDLSYYLNWVELTAISNSDCRLTYGSQVITDRMICVSGNYDEGACIGDSGGPLIQMIDEQVVHVGLSSFISAKGCTSTDPSGYTRTHPYVDWIGNVTSV